MDIVLMCGVEQSRVVDWAVLQLTYVFGVNNDVKVLFVIGDILLSWIDTMVYIIRILQL